MPSAQIQTFTLAPYVALENTPVRRVSGDVARTPNELRVNYVVEGQMEQVSIPKPQPSRFADELWQHTCFELFVARKGEAPYDELNFSPSGQWAAYAFAQYRERVSLLEQVDLSVVNPQVAVHRTANKIELEAIVPLAGPLHRYARAGLLLGLSAVIEGRDGSLSYWALKHPGTKPDFHHPGAFVMEFDEIRN